jgi:ABC-2 type transport system permease protein
MTDLRRSATARGRHVAPATAIWLSYQVVLRQLASRGRIIGLSLLALIAPISGWALGSADASLDDAVRLVASVGLGLVLPIVSLVFGGAALGDLREDKTLVYLWLRPMDRWPIVVGAAMAAATLAAPITIVSIVAAAVLTGAGNGIVFATLVATVVGLVAYVAVFTLFGVWLKRFIVWGLAYILIWEGFIAQAGAGVARVALRKYTRSILVDRTGVNLQLADFTMTTAVVVPLVVAVAALAIAAWRLSNQDID